jgi:hypothetical protein
VCQLTVTGQLRERRKAGKLLGAQGGHTGQLMSAAGGSALSSGRSAVPVSVRAHFVLRVAVDRVEGDGEGGESRHVV